MTGYDEKALVASLERARKKKVPEKTVTTQLRQMIVSVSGDASSEAIKFFIENVPSMDSRHLRLAYELAAPNVDLTQHFECSECDHEQEMEVPLTADFFGLTDDYMENVYEQFFFLKYSGGWSFSEAYNLPLGLRKWFVQRLAKQIKDESDAIKNASRGSGTSTQTLSAHNQPSVPAKYRST